MTSASASVPTSSTRCSPTSRRTATEPPTMQAHILPAPIAGPAALRPLVLALEALDTAACWVICASIAVMVVVVSAQVGLRYGLNQSLGWADEISRLCFVWSIFLAIPLGIRAR